MASAQALSDMVEATFDIDKQAHQLVKQNQETTADISPILFHQHGAEVTHAVSGLPKPSIPPAKAGYPLSQQLAALPGTVAIFEGT